MTSDLDRLITEIHFDMRETGDLTGQYSLSKATENALRQVPREHFVTTTDKSLAYANQPLLIGHGQTVSQPFIVALMTQMLSCSKNDIVLEIGTGSGYQAAVLSNLVKHVHSIEVIHELAAQAKERLPTLGYKNITVYEGDGTFGVKEHAPYDAIIATAASETVPPALIEQLKVGGRLLIPLGEQYQAQELYLFTKDPQKTLTKQRVLPVRFVPFVHEPHTHS